MSETYTLTALIKAKTMDAYRKVNDFGKLIGKTTKEMSAFQKAGSVAAGMLMRDMVQGATAAFAEAIKLGSSVTTLTRSFQALTSSQGVEEASLDALRKAVKGTVSDVDLLTAANTALSFKIPYEQFKSYAAAATVVGRSVGITATKSINDFTVALGRLSPRVLDNIGIQLQLGEANEIYARRLGTTVDALSESERRMAFSTIATERLMEKAAILEGTTSEAQLATERFSASMKNLKTNIGSVLAPLGALTPIFQATMPLIGTLAGTLIPGLIRSYVEATVATQALTAAQWASKIASDALKVAMGPIGWAIMAVSAAVAGILLLYNHLTKSTDTLKTAQGELAAAQRVHTDITREQEQALSELTMATEALESAQEDELDVLVDLADKTGALERAQQNMASTLAWLRGDIESVDLATKGLTWTSDEARQRFSSLRSELQGLQDEFRATSDIANGFRGQLDDLSLEESKLRLKQMRLRDAFEDGRISQKNYEKSSARLENALRGLDIQQAELRIQLTETEDALKTQGDEIDEVEGRAGALAEADDALETATSDLDKSLEAAAEKQAATAEAMATLAEKERLAEEAAKDLKSALDDLESKKIEVDVIITEQRRRKEEQKSEEGFPGYPGEEEYIPQVIPSVFGQHGYEGWVRKPTMFIAGEREPEYISISTQAMEAARRKRGTMRGFAQVGIGRLEESAFERPSTFLAPRGGPEQVRTAEVSAAGPAVAIKGPLIQVMGSMDKATAAYAVEIMKQELKNVIVEPTSSQAPATKKKITMGGGGTTKSWVVY